MGPIDHFIQQMTTIIDSHATDAQKTEQIAQVMASAEQVFEGYQAAPKAGELHQLADRIAPLSSQHAEELRTYADAILFPRELVDRIRSEIHPVEAGGFFLASKETQIDFLKNLQVPLREINIKTAQAAIEFAKSSGQHLTHLDISGIYFKSDELVELLQHTPNITTFIAKGSSYLGQAFQEIIKLKLTRLEFEDRLGVNGAEIATAPNLKGLKTLNLAGTYIANEGVQAIATSLTNLEQLDLSANHIDDSAMPAIASMQKLTKLTLRANPIGPEGATALAKSTSIKQLDLSQTGIEQTGIEAIARMPQLTHLTLRNIELGGPSFATAIANSETLTELLELDLSGNNILDEGVQTLANAPNLGKLTFLRLSNNSLKDAGTQALADSTSLKALRKLDLSNNRIFFFLKTIADSPNMKDLTHLDLSDNPCRNDAAVAIAQSKTLHQLVDLNLKRTSIESWGVALLAGSPVMATVRVLNLAQNSVGDEGALALARSNFLPELKELNLTSADVSSRTLEYFKPSVKIVF